MKLIKNYLYKVSYDIFILLVPIITAPYIARILGAHNIGIFAYVNSVVSLIMNIALLGTYTYGCREVAYVSKQKDTSVVFREIFTLRILLLAVSSVIYFGVALLEKHFGIYYLLYFLWFVSNYIDVSWLFVGKEDMKIPTIKNFVGKIIFIVCLFLFVKDKNDLNIYFILNAVISFMSNVSIFPQLKKYVTFGKLNLKNSYKHLLPCVQLFLPSIASILYIQIDKIMLQYFTDMSNVAYYEQAEKIVKVPLAIVTSLAVVMMPKVANKIKNNFNKEEVIKDIVFGLNFCSILVYPMAIGIACISYQVVPWYLGKEFLPVARIMIALSPIIITNAYRNISGNVYLVAANKTNVLTISNVMACVINLIVNIVLIPVYGVVGAAMGTVIAEVVCFGIQSYYLIKDLKIAKYYIQSLKYLVYGIPMGVFLIYFTNKASSNVYNTFIEVFLGVLIYGGTLLILKDRYTIKILDILKDRIKK